MHDICLASVFFFSLQSAYYIFVQHKFWSSSLCNFLRSPLVFSLLPQIFSSELFIHAPSVYVFFLSVRSKQASNIGSSTLTCHFVHVLYWWISFVVRVNTYYYSVYVQTTRCERIKETWDPSHCYLRTYWTVLNDGSLDMILSLPLFGRPSALLQIRVSSKNHRCLWGFLEQRIDGPTRGLDVRWTRKGQKKANAYAQTVIRARKLRVWTVLSLTPRENVANVS